MIAPLSLALVACGAGFSCTGDAGPGQPGATGAEDRPQASSPPPIVSTKLSVEGDHLLVSLKNLTDIAGQVSTSAMISGPSGVYYTAKAGEASFGPGQSITLRLESGSVNGLRLGEEEWADARISYEVHLADGRASGDPLAVFVDHGVEAEPREVVASGQLHGAPDAPIADDGADGSVEKATTVRFCFQHAVAFSGVTQPGLDRFASPSVPAFPAHGLVLDYVGPTGSGQSGNATLDSAGCKSLPRVAGTWTFTPYLIARNYPASGNVMSAVSTINPVKGRAVTVSVPSSGNPSPARATIQMGNGTNSDSAMQTAFVAIQNMLVSAFQLGSVVPTNAQLTILSITSGAAVACPGNADGCRVGNEIHLTNTGGLRRSTPAHEAGHWVEGLWANVFGNDYSYCSGDGCKVPPSDGCLRTPDGTHNIGTIEWQGAAHMEGFADFMAMLAYNNLGSGADCTIADFDLFAGGQGLTTSNCEEVGLALKHNPRGGVCWEWNNTDILNATGVEYDWAKMYWDLFNDYSGLGPHPLVDYLTAESQVPSSSWGRTGHLTQIIAQMGGALEQAMSSAASGNVYDGPAH